MSTFCFHEPWKVLLPASPGWFLTRKIFGKTIEKTSARSQATAWERNLEATASEERAPGWSLGSSETPFWFRLGRVRKLFCQSWFYFDVSKKRNLRGALERPVYRKHGFVP
uniref:Uncharacterized protein n=1 Tax=Candidatus Kentrum sp. LFY TaxID=2126342 RepID=A0A450UG08_9GAMM|nr:MAG: hypothetical protein BECKLFY1418A_GA0070994_101619 [Candidatus Kentron sp. LFY]